MIRIGPALLLLALAVAPAGAGDPAEIVGAWRILGTDEQGHPRAAVLYLQEDDGKLTGRWNTSAGSIELREVSYEGDRLSFWWYVDIQRTLIKLYFTAKVDGDEFEGQLREPHTIGKVRGERIGVKHAGPPADDAGTEPAADAAADPP